MTDAQLKAFLKAMRKLTRENTSSPRKARAVLVKAGVVTRSGKLTAMYR